jgi:hypothetical protein
VLGRDSGFVLTYAPSGSGTRCCSPRCNFCFNVEGLSTSLGLATGIGVSSAVVEVRVSIFDDSVSAPQHTNTHPPFPKGPCLTTILDEDVDLQTLHGRAAVEDGVDARARAVEDSHC